jgi:phosphoribosylanthranilate isomerase
VSEREAGAGLAVKICGLTRSVDARQAQRVGADYLGFVLSSGFGRSVPEAHAAEVVAGTSVPRVAVLVDESPASATRLARSIDASVLQLHGDEGRSTVLALREAGDWAIWKAVRARGPEDISRIVDDLGDVVDGLLVEGWREGVIGGGGVPLAVDHRAVRAAVPEGLLFILAGGLTPESVGEGVARFAPDVVDVSSGVERSPGRKAHDRLEAFVRSARAGSDPRPGREP